MKPQEAFDRIVFKAQVKAMGGYEAHTVAKSLRLGEPIPDSCLPGRFILGCSPELREALKGLTPEMTQQRLY